jgi:hypothetical protein
MILNAKKNPNFECPHDGQCLRVCNSVLLKMVDMVRDSSDETKHPKYSDKLLQNLFTGTVYKQLKDDSFTLTETPYQPAASCTQEVESVAELVLKWNSSENSDTKQRIHNELLVALSRLPDAGCGVGRRLLDIVSEWQAGDSSEEMTRGVYAMPCNAVTLQQVILTSNSLDFVKLSPSGDLLAVCFRGADAGIGVYTTESPGQLVWMWKCESQFTSLAFGPFGSETLVVGCRNDRRFDFSSEDDSPDVTPSRNMTFSLVRLWQPNEKPETLPLWTFLSRQESLKARINWTKHSFGSIVLECYSTAFKYFSMHFSIANRRLQELNEQLKLQNLNAESYDNNQVTV